MTRVVHCAGLGCGPKYSFALSPARSTVTARIIVASSLLPPGKRYKVGQQQQSKTSLLAHHSIIELPTVRFLLSTRFRCVCVCVCGGGGGGGEWRAEEKIMMCKVKSVKGAIDLL